VVFLKEKVMISLRAIVTSGIVAIVGLSGLGASAQDASSAAGIQKKLVEQFPLTKATADKTDIVTAGAVLVLEKDNLLMYTVTTTVPPQNTYKNGKISHGVFDAAKKCKFCAYVPVVGSAAAAVPNVDQRTFVSGEKFWVTGIEAHDDGIVFNLLSDPYSDVRYYSQLKFPYPKGSALSADTMMSTVAEVLKVQPSDDSASSSGDAKQPQQQQQQSAGQPASAGQSAPAGGQPSGQPGGQAAMAPIAPPPPPADAPPAAPKTIAVGQTKDQVAAIFGQPTKVIKLSGKEIDVYPDMKVTFVNNKVADVQ
jgi:hypothetical protein